ncbi:MAG: sialidase family protein [Planctomycetota bacterium]
MPHTPLASLLTALLAIPLAAQQARPQGHDEKPDQPPATNPLAGSNPFGPRTIVRRGPFASIQVNVNGSQTNIPGDAANEPSISVDPNDPNRMVVGWRQFDSVASNFRKNGWAYTSDGGQTWTFPGSIRPAEFNSDPVVDIDTGGNFYYLSYPANTNSRLLYLFKSTNGGAAWGPATNLTGGDKAWLLVDRSASSGQDFLYVIWQTAYGPNTFVRSTNGGASFSSAFAVPSRPTFGTMATANNGDLFCFGLVNQNFGSFVMAKSVNARNAAQNPAFTSVSVAMGGRMVINGAPNPGGLLGQAQVATDPTRPNNVYALCSIDDPSADPCDIRIATSTNGGSSFAATTRINDDATGNGAWQWFGTLSVAPTGRIDVVWNDTRNTGSATRSETYYAFSLDGGSSWSRNVPVSPSWNSVVGWPNQNKIGDYYDMKSTVAAAHLAYSATFNNEQDVYYLRLGDCNANGQHDGVDIANGDSFDSNRNTIPDECETCQSDLGFGNGLGLSVCGDDLATAGSIATVLATGATGGAPVYLVVSNNRYATPIPIPGGGRLLPDIGTGVVLGPLPTDARGRVAFPVNGGAAAVASYYLQAASVTPSLTIVLSNAVEARIGT